MGGPITCWLSHLLGSRLVEKTTRLPGCSRVLVQGQDLLKGSSIPTMGKNKDSSPYTLRSLEIPHALPSLTDGETETQRE